jgi:NADPH:quinone reductase-like Zn-dependent oxidoreductase
MESTVAEGRPLRAVQPPIPAGMSGVLLVGHGDLDQLEYREDIKVPTPEPEEVLIRVAAAAINNTDINTRTGWYSKSVKSGTGEDAAQGVGTSQDADATWTGNPLSFPRIQGANCCGYIVAVGSNVDPGRIGERVIVQNTLRSYVN